MTILSKEQLFKNESVSDTPFFPVYSQIYAFNTQDVMGFQRPFTKVGIIISWFLGSEPKFYNVTSYSRYLRFWVPKFKQLKN